MTPEISRRDALLTAALAALALPTRAFGQAPPLPGAAAAWDLTDLYASDAAWTTERDATARRVPELTKYRGHLADSAASLNAALQAQSDIGIKIARLYTYASLKADEDLRVSPNQERKQLALDLYSSFSEAVAFTSPELLAAGKPKIEGFLAAEPKLAKFRFQLEDTLRQEPHTLGAEAEGVLAATTSPLAGPEDVRDQLASSDIPRPEVTLSDGTKARLDDQGYTLHRTAAARADRKLVFDKFWGSYQPFESSLGAALTAQVKGEMFLAKSRKYPDSLSSALSGPNLPVGVYRTLVAETNNGLPVLHRYFELRRRMLSLPDLAYYDLYPSLVALDRHFAFDEMRTLTLAAVKPLGPDYNATFAKATSARWMDPRPRTGKASGAYMNGSAYDVHPFLLLNLSDQYDGLTTYAHEWGHAMHSLLANAAQPFETAQYPTFIAEIASTCHETLLVRMMLAGARTKQEKLFYLGQIMEGIRTTFFRQTMLAEFQLAIHELAEKGEGLSGARFTQTFLDLLKRYHGPKVTIDPLYGIEWGYIPHYYQGFYVFQYATSITAANFFADRVLGGGAAERERYLSVLKAGGSDYGYAILQKAGLDMATATPYRAIIATFSRALDQAEALLA